MKNIVALLLAGGRVDELLCLTSRRAKAALPIFGIYRFIDFALSNCMHAAIDNIGVLSQYRPHALMRHIGSGEHWDFTGRQRSVRILPPYSGHAGSDWYQGTADAVYQNIAFIEEFSPEHVLIASGDHVYRMDYRPLIQFHIDHNADATVCFTHVPTVHTRFGYGMIDAHDRLIAYEEKPSSPPSDLVSMTLYVFKTRVLIDVLRANAGMSSHEFGRDIIPSMITDYKVYGCLHDGYWAYARSINSYYRTNMDFLEGKIDLHAWQIRTNLLERCAHRDRLPARIDGHAVNSVIGDECVVEGSVEDSILSPGVIIEEHAVVKHAVIFHDTVVHRHAHISRAICDKDVHIHDGAEIGLRGDDVPSKKFGALLNTGITVVGRKATIAHNVRIGANSIIMPSAHVTAMDIPPGSTVG
ncbi:MAG: glucose-1-phosphate adenylyltransferase [candidate division WOR-3 bacterium]|nr:MAG: glucose-1-phosphate adenylyltransferase [candidate division WOR-3 bacterium]